MATKKKVAKKRVAGAGWSFHKQTDGTWNAVFSGEFRRVTTEELDRLWEESATFSETASTRTLRSLSIEICCNESTIPNPYQAMPELFSAVVRPLCDVKWPNLSALRLALPDKQVRRLGHRYMVEWLEETEPVSYLSPEVATQLCAAMPNLNTMVVAGHTMLPGLEHARLADLRLVGCCTVSNLGQDDWPAAPGINLPGLRRLEIAEMEDGESRVQFPMFFQFSKERTPALQELILRDSCIAPYCDGDQQIGLVDILASSNLLPQLRVLSIPEFGLCWDIDRMQVLRDLAPKFSKLKRLVIKQLESDLDLPEVQAIFPQLAVEA